MYTFLSRHALIQKFKLIHTYSYSIIYCLARLTVCVCVYCILIFAVIIKPSHVLINVLFLFVRCVNYMWRSFYLIKNLIQKLVTFLRASDMCKQSIINFNFDPKKNFSTFRILGGSHFSNAISQFSFVCLFYGYRYPSTAIAMSQSDYFAGWPKLILCLFILLQTVNFSGIYCILVER